MAPKLRKGVYLKHTTKIIINDERMNTFPLRSGKIQGCLLLPLLFNTLLEFQEKIIRQEKEIKIIQIGKEKVKLYVCR